jgi:P27 family predicted phage terminase small subunit
MKTGFTEQRPKHLSPQGRKAFKRAVQILEQRRTLTESDEPILTLFADTYALWVNAKTEVGDELMISTTVTDNNGNVRTVRRANPMIKVMEAAAVRLFALSKSLGFSQVDIGRCKPTAEVTPEKTAQQLAEEACDIFRPRELSGPGPRIVPMPPTTSEEDDDVR